MGVSLMPRVSILYSRVIFGYPVFISFFLVQILTDTLTLHESETCFHTQLDERKEARNAFKRSYSVKTKDKRGEIMKRQYERMYIHSIEDYF